MSFDELVEVFADPGRLTPGEPPYPPASGEYPAMFSFKRATYLGGLLESPLSPDLPTPFLADPVAIEAAERGDRVRHASRRAVSAPSPSSLLLDPDFSRAGEVHAFADVLLYGTDLVDSSALIPSRLNYLRFAFSDEQRDPYIEGSWEPAGDRLAGVSYQDSDDGGLGREYYIYAQTMGEERAGVSQALDIASRSLDELEILIDYLPAYWADPGDRELRVSLFGAGLNGSRLLDVSGPSTRRTEVFRVPREPQPTHPAARIDQLSDAAEQKADRIEVLTNYVRVYSVDVRVPSAPEGDADGNGVVDVNDVTYVARRLGMSGPDGDVDGDGVIDVNDITLVVRRLGN